MAQGRLLNWLAPTEQAASIIRRQPAAAVQPMLIAVTAAVALDLCGAIAHLLNSIAGVVGHPYWLANSLAAASFALLGGLILAHRPGHRLGALFVAGGLFTAAGVVAGEFRPYGLLVGVDSLPGAVFLAWVGNWIWSLGVGVIGTSLLFFPDGHLATPRWRLVVVAFAVGVGLTMVGDALMPGRMRLMPATNPVGLQGVAGFLDLLRLTGAALQVCSTLAAIIGLLVRLRSARGVEREQIRWFAYAGAVSLALLVGGIALDGYIGVRVLGPVGGSLGVGVVLPAALTVAVLRYRLLALDRLINRTLVYALLTLGVAVLYISVVGYAAATLQGGGATAVSLLLTAAVAVGFQPCVSNCNGLSIGCCTDSATSRMRLCRSWAGGWKHRSRRRPS